MSTDADRNRCRRHHGPAGRRDRQRGELVAARRRRSRRRDPPRGRTGAARRVPALGGCQPGEARRHVATGSRRTHVIHAVGPVWRGGGAGEARTLAVVPPHASSSPPRKAAARRVPGDLDRRLRLSDGAGGAVALARPGRRSHAAARLVRFVLFDEAMPRIYERAYAGDSGSWVLGREEDVGMSTSAGSTPRTVTSTIVATRDAIGIASST